MSGARDKSASGLRLPMDLPEDLDAMGVAQHHLNCLVADFDRTRRVVKRRAKWVVVLSAAGTSMIAVVGAATAITGWSSLGIISASLAGSVSVLGAWDGMFRHRELWLQRSSILSQLQQLNRTMQFRLALGHVRNEVASDILDELNAILAEDIDSWSALRNRRQLTSDEGN